METASPFFRKQLLFFCDLLLISYLHLSNPIVTKENLGKVRNMTDFVIIVSCNI